MSKTKTKIQGRRQKERQHKILITMLAGGLLLIISGVFFAKSARENRADPSLIEVSGQPSLIIDQERIDYGDVKLNTNLQFKLELTNVGDQPLRISENPYVEVVEGCWPPSLTIGSMVLKPGQTTTVESGVFMMHAGMDGPHDFRVHIKTNDPDNPDKTVAVLSNWVP